MPTCFCEERKWSPWAIGYILKRNLEVEKGSYENAEKPERYPTGNQNLKRRLQEKPQTFHKFYMTPKSSFFFFFSIFGSPICYFDLLIFFGNTVDMLSFI